MKILGLELNKLFQGDRTLTYVRTTLPSFLMAVIGYFFIFIYALNFPSEQFKEIFGSLTLIVGGFLFQVLC